MVPVTNKSLWSAPQGRDEQTVKFLIGVQSWYDKIESNPVLIRKIFENHQSDPVLILPCKIMCFYFAS